MKRNRLIINRNWFRVGNVFNLLVEIDGHIFCKKFYAESVDDYAQSVIDLNKTLKEYDMIEEIKRRFNIRKVQFK